MSKIINKDTQKELDKQKAKLKRLSYDIDLEIAKGVYYDYPKEEVTKKVDKLIENVPFVVIGSSELAKYYQHYEKSARKITDTNFVATVELNRSFGLQKAYYEQLNALKGSGLNSFDRLYQEKLDIRKSLANGTLTDQEINKLTNDKIKDRLVHDNGMTYVRRSNGSKEKIQYWYDRNARYEFTQRYDDIRRQVMDKHALDLVIISEHFDASDRCAPFQGKIYSESGKDLRYPPLEEALSGGIHSYNCRHNIEIYDPDVTDMGAFEVKQTEEERQAGYQKRQAENYKRRIAEDKAQRKRIDEALK